MSGAPPRRIVLRPISRCTPAQQEALRELRNHPAIRTAMYSDHIISSAEHAKWIEGLRNDDIQPWGAMPYRAPPLPGKRW